MRSLVKRVVFQPPNDPTCLQHVMLQKQRRHLRFATKANGERVSYLHMHARGVPRYTTPQGAPLVVLYHHGNGENLGLCAEVVRQLVAVLHIDVVAYDYCGYGFSGHVTGGGAAATTSRSTAVAAATTSTSQATCAGGGGGDEGKKPPRTSLGERSVYMDAECMYGELQRLGYAPCQIVLMGRSLGGGPACYLAARHQDEIAGLVLQSTFTSCLEVVSRYILPRCLPWCNMFHNDRHIRDVLRCPILLLHGTEDMVVPFRCSQTLLSIALKARRRDRARAQHRQRKLHKTRQQQGQQPQQPQRDGEGREQALQARGGQSQPTAEHAKRVDDTTSGSLWCTGRTRLRGRATSTTTPSATQPPHDAHAQTHATGADDNSNTEDDDDARAAKELGIWHAWLPGCGHNNMEERASDAYFAELRHFLDVVVRYVATGLATTNHGT